MARPIEIPRTPSPLAPDAMCTPTLSTVRPIPRSAHQIPTPQSKHHAPSPPERYLAHGSPREVDAAAEALAPAPCDDVSASAPLAADDAPPAQEAKPPLRTPLADGPDGPYSGSPSARSSMKATAAAAAAASSTLPTASSTPTATPTTPPMAPLPASAPPRPPSRSRSGRCGDPRASTPVGLPPASGTRAGSSGTLAWAPRRPPHREAAAPVRGVPPSGLPAAARAPADAGVQGHAAHAHARAMHAVYAMGAMHAAASQRLWPGFARRGRPHPYAFAVAAATSALAPPLIPPSAPPLMPAQRPVWPVVPPTQAHPIETLACPAAVDAVIAGTFEVPPPPPPPTPPLDVLEPCAAPSPSVAPSPWAVYPVGVTPPPLTALLRPPVPYSAAASPYRACFYTDRRRAADIAELEVLARWIHPSCSGLPLTADSNALNGANGGGSGSGAAVAAPPGPRLSWASLCAEFERMVRIAGTREFQVRLARLTQWIVASLALPGPLAAQSYASRPATASGPWPWPARPDGAAAGSGAGASPAAAPPTTAPSHAAATGFWATAAELRDMQEGVLAALAAHAA
ncbi:hypothetical protein CXG81DRAFT_25307 [Caulochytrium protostelioides]|uniref:Uncharacterized protein n=1 Tax=Caulochytrium protostelioides TaxID=1555241 RepID=A0A4P9X9J5_9FUNG|nr:hypothetical protein CXG81DRAFT_25307 [Caulochytrium protostelioides]|eukprot:RKP02013.1 hypothetical protein CXG81DRAFT_25307 [Caulochytrium protostelioides]